MADERLLLKKINSQLQAFMEETHIVFRYLAEACDLFVKGDRMKVNNLSTSCSQVVFGKLSELKRNVIKEVAKSYSILPLATEHLKVCFTLWEACYKTVGIIQKLAAITGRSWIEDIAFYDNLGLISSSILNEFETLLEDIVAMAENKERVWKIVDEISEQLLQITRYVESIDKIVLERLDKSPSLLILHEIFADFEVLAEDILKCADLVSAIASTEPAVE